MVIKNRADNDVKWHAQYNLSHPEFTDLVPFYKKKITISLWEQVNFQWDDDNVHFVLDQHAWLDFYSASSLKQHSEGRHVAPLGHIIMIVSQPAFDLSL